VPRQKVYVKSAFPRFKAAMHDAIRAGVEHGSEVGAQTSAAAAPVGDGTSGVDVRPEHLRDTYDVVVSSRSRRGYAGGYGSNDPNALWQELGTQGRRTRKQRRSVGESKRAELRQTRAGRTVGVRAKRIMLRASKPALAATIAGIRTSFGARRFRGV
jgi:hypothetical protein